MSHTLRRHLPLIFTLTFAPLVCCGSLLYLPILFHNIQLNKFAENLYEYPLPPGSETVSRYSKVGLTGNGNHCDFLAELTVATELTREDIEAYYQDVRLPGVGMESSKVFVSVEFDDKDSVDGKLTFQISIFDFGNPSNFDIRCH